MKKVLKTIGGLLLVWIGMTVLFAGLNFHKMPERLSVEQAGLVALTVSGIISGILVVAGGALVAGVGVLVKVFTK